MQNPEYVGAVVCVAADAISAPAVLWCQTTSFIAAACSWVAVAA